MKTLNKLQAARALGISPRTLATRMKSGAVQYTKLEGAKIGEQSVSFTYEQLSIPEPSAAPAPVVHDVQIAPQYNDDPKPDRFTHYMTKVRNRPSEVDEKAAEDQAWAEAYREGRVTDSLGNRSDGTNERWPNQGSVSLLGPITVDHGPPAETQAHMIPGLLGTNDTEGNAAQVPRWGFECGEGFTRGGSQLDKGISQENYDAMMRDWNRRGGGRSEGDQERASLQAVQNINRSFPRG